MMTGGAPAGRPDTARPAVRGAGVVRVSGEVVVTVDPDPLINSREAAELAGCTMRGWWSAVRGGYAPQPDVPDRERPVNRREPKWRTSTVLRYVAGRKPRKKRAPKSADEQQQP